MLSSVLWHQTFSFYLFNKDFVVWTPQTTVFHGWKASEQPEGVEVDLEVDLDRIRVPTVGELAGVRDQVGVAVLGGAVLDLADQDAVAFGERKR